MQRGFSLVELSIVLVILGLLTGGILAGQSLIRAAEMRAVSTEYSKYIAAVNSFRDKYFQLPGDMNNAQKFWGIAAACPGTSATPSTDATTCNGDGSGQLGTVGTSVEYFRFWQHLANAGLIEGTYSGVPAGAGGFDSTAGLNVPRSRMSMGKWDTHYRGQLLSLVPYFDGDYGNAVFFGSQASVTPSGWTMKPEEAWNLDTKMDDGKPGTGKIFSEGYTNCTTGASPSSGGTAEYALTTTTIVCALTFLRAF